MNLRHTYTLWAPIYDLAVAAATRGARRRSLERLGDARDQHILLCGVGTGLDLPHLPHDARYQAIDLTPAMLARARRRTTKLPLTIDFHVGDAMNLPFPERHFDVVILHLILAVVPEPQRALTEAHRVLRPGGRMLILDKFLHRGERAWIRRAINPLSSRLATRTDVVFEPLVERHPDLHLTEDCAAMAGGWFRHIVLEKRSP